MDVSIVRYKDIEKDDLLSAGAFRPKYLRIIEILKKLNAKPLEEIANISKRTLDPTKFPTREFCYIDIANVNTIDGEITTWTFKGWQAPKRARKLVKSGDVIISTVRPRRNAVGLITDDLDGCIASTGFAVMSPKSVNSSYLFAFFKTIFGKYQLIRKERAACYPAILEDDIKKVLIYIPSSDFQLHIERLVKQAYEKRKLAKQKYQQAEEMLYRILGINEEEIEKLESKNTYKTNFEEVKQSLRFDAEYYHPKYLGVIELLRKTPFELKPLKEVVRISNDTIDPTKEPYKTKKFKYVPIAKISEGGEIFEWEEFYGWQAPSRARMIIRKNDILIPSLTGTFEKIALVPEELDGQLATTGCFVIRAKNDYPEFLFLLLRSPLFKRQLERQTTGAIMSAVPKTVFGDSLVPVVPRNEQKEIANLIREYFKLRKEARQLIRRAIREVEEVIENASS